MKEIRVLVFETIKDDSTFQNLTGATASDPRIFWQFTPQKVQVTDSRHTYAVYFRSGTISTTDKVDVAGREDQVYTIEIYSKTPDGCDVVADRLVDMFRDRQYTTNTYSVLRTYASVLGSPIYDDGRNLYVVNVNLYCTRIVAYS
jgi:hypothetical protein